MAAAYFFCLNNALPASRVVPSSMGSVVSSSLSAMPSNLE